MTVMFMSLLLSAFVSGGLAERKQRSPWIWGGLALLTGPIGVALILLAPSRRPGRTVTAIAAPPVPLRSLADEIRDMEEMRQRGIISDDEFAQGKAQVLAWPVSSPIPAELTPERVWADGRRTWASYQPAVRAACLDLARRHRIDLRWRDDVPMEVVCTYPAQPGLSLEISIGLEKGSLRCWGDGWELDGIAIVRPDKGVPSDLLAGLDALIGGTGRVIAWTAAGASSPSRIALQVSATGGWRTVKRQGGPAFRPFWRPQVFTNRCAGPA